MSQNNADVAFNPGSSEFLVVWEDGRPNVSGNYSDVYGQRVGIGGSLVGGNFGISTAPGDQRFPAVACKNGQCLVIYAEYSNGDIYGQRVASNGTMVGGPIFVSACSLYTNRWPDVAYSNGTDSYLVVWTDDRNQVPPTGWDIYGKLVGSNGSVGTEIAISTTTPYQYYPKVAHDYVDDEFLVVWKENNDIYGQVVSGTGTLVGGNFAICTAVNNQSYPAVAYDGTNNQFLVVWDDHRTDAATGKDIYGQLVAGGGGLVGGNFAISTDPATQWKADVAYSAVDDEFKVVWFDDRNFPTNSRDIYGQMVDRNGMLVGNNFPISNEVSDQYDPAIAYGDTLDEFLAVWEDWRNLGSTLLDIYGETEPNPLSRYHKMHFAQLPDMGFTGVDVEFRCGPGTDEGIILADDWMCSESGDVTDIHFWFSAEGDWLHPDSLSSQILNIHLSIHSNEPGPPSMPGDSLWTADFAPDDPEVDIILYGTSLPDSQDYYDPGPLGMYLPRNHVDVYLCNIENISDPFYQEMDSIYWLDVTLATKDDRPVGWKTADFWSYPDPYEGQAFMDDAVWGLCDLMPYPMWSPLVYPSQHPYAGMSMDLAFVITGNEEATSVGDMQDGAPRSYMRIENHPNPFNPATTIHFGLPEPGRVMLSVYDLSGRLVVVLADEDYLAGEFSKTWDGRDANGDEVASGIYFARLEAGDFVATRKMVLLR